MILDHIEFTRCMTKGGAVGHLAKRANPWIGTGGIKVLVRQRVALGGLAEGAGACFGAGSRLKLMFQRQTLGCLTNPASHRCAATGINPFMLAAAAGDKHCENKTQADTGRHFLHNNTP